jgi:hypothetical protein
LLELVVPHSRHRGACPLPCCHLAPRCGSQDDALAAVAAIDFELVYASAAAANGVLLPPPRTAAVVARGSALIAVAGAVPEDDALLALLYEGRPVCGAR